MSIHATVELYLERNQSEDPLFIVNIGDFISQYEQWMHHLPNIRPFYAINFNPNPLIMKVLYRLGCGFDCASINQIETVNIMQFARAHDVDLMTVDSEHELHKIKLHCPAARLVVRIIDDDTESITQFSSKFGCDITEGENVMKIAKQLDLNIVGVSFHVGTG